MVWRASDIQIDMARGRTRELVGSKIRTVQTLITIFRSDPSRSHSLLNKKHNVQTFFSKPLLAANISQRLCLTPRDEDQVFAFPGEYIFMRHSLLLLIISTINEGNSCLRRPGAKKGDGN